MLIVQREEAQYLVPLNGFIGAYQKVAGCRPDEVKQFVSLYLILLASIGHRVHSASKRSEYQKQKNNVSEEKRAAGA
jgi:hypothetical protein